MTPRWRAGCWIRCCLVLLLCPLLCPWLCPMAVAAAAHTDSQSVHSQISHGRFANVTMYAPRQGAVQQVVLMLSGDGGWSRTMARMATALTEEGALVAGIDTPQLFAALTRDDADCVFPDGDLENLSHYIQAYYRLPTYHTPLLVGYSSGATFAYSMLAQAPAGTFAGALSLGFCVDLELQKPLCKAGTLHYKRRKDGSAVDLLPAAKLPASWVALHGARDRVCSAAAARTFLASIAGAQFVSLPDIGHGYGANGNWLAQYKAAYAQLTRQHAGTLTAPPQDLPGLPIIEVPVNAQINEGNVHGDTQGNTQGNAQGNIPINTSGDTFAIMLSGDGGWAGLDKEVAAALTQSGIPVAGLDSLRYFWSKRTPASLAADLDRIVRYYGAHWHRQRVLLIGYSQGADVLPFAVAQLPAQTQQAIALIALLGLGERAHFEFHFSNWVKQDKEGLPIAPQIAQIAQIARLRSGKILCLYGEDETDSLCPDVASAQVQAVKLQGGHHFNGNYRQLAELIIAAAVR